MKVKFENGEYKAIGEFDFGFGGIFKNDENGNGNIKIVLYEEDYERMKLKSEETDKIALKIEKFINKIQKVVKKYNGRLKNAYLVSKFENFIYGRQNFWGNVVSFSDYQNNKDKYDDLINESIQKNIQSLDRILEFYSIQYENRNLTSIFPKSNVEKNFRKMFKFIDFDKLLNAVTPKELEFSDMDFSFDLSNDLIDEFSNGYYSNSYNKKLNDE